MKERDLLLWLIATSTMTVFAATSGRAQDTTSAKSFVQHVYAGYSNSEWQHEAGRQNKFYTRSLNRMIVADANRHLGETSNLDFDPLCACQDPGDPGEFKVQTIRLTAVAATRMKASVSFRITTAQRTVTLLLFRTASGWRIDDISSQGMRSLRGLLAKPERL